MLHGMQLHSCQSQNKQQLLWAIKMGIVASQKQTNNSYCGPSKWVQLPVTKQTTVIQLIVGYQNGHSCQSYNIQQLLWVIKMGAVARHKTDNSYCGLSKCTVARHKTNNNYYPQAVKMSTVASHKTNKQQVLWAMKMGTVTSHKTNNSCCGLPNCQNSLTQ